MGSDDHSFADMKFTVQVLEKYMLLNIIKIILWVLSEYHKNYNSVQEEFYPVKTSKEGGSY